MFPWNKMMTVVKGKERMEYPERHYFWNPPYFVTYPTLSIISKLGLCTQRKEKCKKLNFPNPPPSTNFQHIQKTRGMNVVSEN